MSVVVSACSQNTYRHAHLAIIHRSLQECAYCGDVRLAAEIAACRKGIAPIGEILLLHLLSVIRSPGAVAPDGRATNGQHAQARAPGSEELHPHIPGHQAV